MTKHLAPAACIFPRSARLCHEFLRRVRSTQSCGKADFAASGCCWGCWGCWYCYYYCYYYCSGPGRACFVVLASWAPIYRNCRKARAAHKVKSRCASGSFMGLLTNSLIGSSRLASESTIPSAELFLVLAERRMSSLQGRLSYHDRSSPNMKRYVRDPYFRK